MGNIAETNGSKYIVEARECEISLMVINATEEDEGDYLCYFGME